MPCIRDENLVEALANEYIKNGMNKSKALIAVGYKEKYAHTLGLRLLEDIRVREAIARIKAKTTKDISLTVADVLADLEYGLNEAKNRKPPDLQAIARFSELRGKTLAMFTDKVLQQGDGLKLNFTTQGPRLAQDKQTG